MSQGLTAERFISSELEAELFESEPSQTFKVLR